MAGVALLSGVIAGGSVAWFFLRRPAFADSILVLGLLGAALLPWLLLRGRERLITSALTAGFTLLGLAAIALLLALFRSMLP